MFFAELNAFDFITAEGAIEMRVLDLVSAAGAT
jgi:hypothetical protein